MRLPLQHLGKFSKPLRMGGPGGGGDQIAVNVRLVDANIRIMPAAESHFGSASRVSATGTAFKNTRGGQKLRAMAVIERISHRVAVMYLGEIVEIGPRQAIFANPQHPYTQKLIAAIPKTDPSRRHLLREANNDELPSPFRDKDWQPPTRRYEQVGNQHWVMR